MGTNFYWKDYTDSDFLRDLAYSKGLPGKEGPFCSRFDGSLITIAERLDGLEQKSSRFHIGKRSAAGLYCWDCRVTLCKGGEERIHFAPPDEWHLHCPKCGAPPIKEDFTEEGPMAVELGFAAPREDRPLGVRGCSSFSWSVDPDVARVRAGRYYGVTENGVHVRKSSTIVVDEYGREMGGLEFLEMLRANCPIEYTRSIGKEFS